MRRRTKAAAALGLAAAAPVLRRVATDQSLRTRLRRSFRVWRLTARRGAHLVVVKVRGSVVDEQRRKALDEQFAIRSAEDVARELGNMKGAIMKAGQMLSFIIDSLPPEAQKALASLQADVEPMAPSLAESVVEADLGASPEDLFLDWEPVPVAAASIGQVHRAVLHDGRLVAVKVQYPGVAEAIQGDLDNAEMLYGVVAGFTMRNMDVRSVVDELRARMGDELDYRIELASQTGFHLRFQDHPFIRVPRPVPELSGRRVLTTEWAEGRRWQELLDSGTEAEHQRAAEVLFRFAQESVHLHGVFNGDPHPGNYFFGDDGTVTFLDFGMVKRWGPDEFTVLDQILDPVLDRDARGVTDRMVDAGFLPPDHGLDPDRVFACVGAPYEPFLVDEFTFTRSHFQAAMAKVFDLTGEYGDVITSLNLPASFVLLNRVQWGMGALLTKLGATNCWRAMLAEYRSGGPPATELGRQEAAWRAAAGAATT